MLMESHSLSPGRGCWRGGGTGERGSSLSGVVGTVVAQARRVITVGVVGAVVAPVRGGIAVGGRSWDMAVRRLRGPWVDYADAIAGKGPPRAPVSSLTIIATLNAVSCTTNSSGKFANLCSIGHWGAPK